MTETDLQRAIISALTKAGYWAFQVSSGAFRGAGGYVRGAPRGTPDICVVDPPGWLEVKLPGWNPGRPPRTETEKAQTEFRRRAAERRVRCAVVTSAREALEIVAGWKLACALHGNRLQSVDMRQFGGRLLAARMGRELTQVKVATAAGLTKGYLSLLERGERQPSMGTVEALARALDVPPEWLSFGSGDPGFEVSL